MDESELYKENNTYLKRRLSLLILDINNAHTNINTDYEISSARFEQYRKSLIEYSASFETRLLSEVGRKLPLSAFPWRKHIVAMIYGQNYILLILFSTTHNVSLLGSGLLSGETQGHTTPRWLSAV